MHSIRWKKCFDALAVLSCYCYRQQSILTNLETAHVVTPSAPPASPAELLVLGYEKITGLLGVSDLNDLNEEYLRLAKDAERLLLACQRRGVSLASYYSDTLISDSLAEADQKTVFANKLCQLIVVPEADDPEKICRFEQIYDSSELVKTQLIPTLSEVIEELIGHQVLLFKDKCNVKSPGGGAFAPHQDIVAYQEFGNDFHITAALCLDPATQENGQLMMARNYQQAGLPCIAKRQTQLGEFPIFPWLQGQTNHGAIASDIAAQFTWEAVTCQAGDVILFNSYVPHQSATNQSTQPRRMLFFTFNLATAGDHYHAYYRNKREHYGHPKFHIGTPTQHDALPNLPFDGETSKTTIQGKN